MRILTFDRLLPEKGISYSRDHLRRMCKAGTFPAPINLTGSRIAWPEDEVDAWIKQRISKRADQKVAA